MVTVVAARTAIAVPECAGDSGGLVLNFQNGPLVSINSTIIVYSFLKKTAALFPRTGDPRVPSNDERYVSSPGYVQWKKGVSMI